MEKAASPIPEAEKHKTPQLPFEEFSDVVSQLHHDKNCKKPGCYGRGFTGVSIDPTTNKKTLIICSCATFNDTGYTVLSKRLEKHQGEVEETLRAIMSNQVALHGHITKKFREAENAKIWSKVKGLFRKKPLEIRKANDISEHIRKGEPLPGPPQHQPVPVTGDVNAGQPLTKPLESPIFTRESHSTQD